MNASGTKITLLWVFVYLQALVQTPLLLIPGPFVCHNAGEHGLIPRR